MYNCCSTISPTTITKNLVFVITCQKKTHHMPARAKHFNTPAEGLTFAFDVTITQLKTSEFKIKPIILFSISKN